MFTQNYLNLRKMQFTAVNQKITDCTGNNQTAQATNKNDYWDMGRNLGFVATSTTMPTTYSNGVTDKWVGVRFGTGPTPPSKNDYTLAAPILSGLSVQKGTVFNMEEVDGRYVYMNTFVLTNTTDSEMAIWEAGVYAPVNIGAGTNVSQYWCTLIDRIVLAEPILLEPGESKLVTYKLTFNQTLNVE